MLTIKESSIPLFMERLGMIRKRLSRFKRVYVESTTPSEKELEVYRSKFVAAASQRITTSSGRISKLFFPEATIMSAINTRLNVIELGEEYISLDIVDDALRSPDVVCEITPAGSYVEFMSGIPFKVVGMGTHYTRMHVKVKYVHPDLELMFALNAAIDFLDELNRRIHRTHDMSCLNLNPGTNPNKPARDMQYNIGITSYEEETLEKTERLLQTLKARAEEIVNECQQ